MDGKTEAENAERKSGFFLIRWFRGLYEWVMHWADTPYAAKMLAVLSFAESSFFPIPPDVLLIPMAISRPDKAIRFGAITWVASVLGGIGGYLIGMLFFDTVGIRIIEFYGVMDKYFLFRQWFEEYNFAIIMVAGMTPLPYKVFTITAGVAQVNLPIFILGSVLSRGVRFMAEGVVCHYGDDVFKKYFKMSLREFLDKYINWFMIGMAVLGVAGFLVVKPLLPGSEVDLTRELAMAGGQEAKAHFVSTPDSADATLFNYRLALAMDGSSVHADIPGGPFPEPSRGDAEVLSIKSDDKTNLVAAVFYSELPAPELGTDGHATLYRVGDKGLEYLQTLDFQRYRLETGGAWLEGSIDFSEKPLENGNNAIVAKIRYIHHAAVRGEEDTETTEEFHYRLIGGKLVVIGHSKTRPVPVGKE